MYKYNIHIEKYYLKLLTNSGIIPEHVIKKKVPEPKHNTNPNPVAGIPNQELDKRINYKINKYSTIQSNITQKCSNRCH